MLHRGLDEDEPALERLEADSELWMALPAGIIQGWPRMEAPARDALDAGMDAVPAAEPDHAGAEGVHDDAPAEPPRREAPSPVAQAAALAALKAPPAAPAAPRSQPAIPRSALAGLARPAVAAKPATPKAEKKPAKVIALPPLSRSVAGLKKMAAQNGQANPTKPQADTPPLGKLLSSIKRDIEQLRSEQLPPSVLKPKVALTKKVKPAEPVSPVAEPEPPRPAPPEVLETKGTAAPPSAEKEPPAPPAPIQDEWGFFDPNQCGFAALLTKLDEITEEKEKKTKRRR